MTRKTPLPTLAEVRRLLSYDPETGLFARRVDSGGRRAGTDAGYVNNMGYVSISVMDSKELAHRLAWLLMTGKWPTLQIDHKDCDRKNNRWSNLREATMAEQRRNMSLAKNNTSGVAGVYRKRKRWEAAIGLGGRFIRLGVFDTIEEAAAARAAGVVKYHGEFGRVR